MIKSTGIWAPALHGGCCHRNSEDGTSLAYFGRGRLRVSNGRSAHHRGQPSSPLRRRLSWLGAWPQWVTSSRAGSRRVPRLCCRCRCPLAEADRRVADENRSPSGACFIDSGNRRLDARGGEERQPMIQLPIAWLAARRNPWAPPLVIRRQSARRFRGRHSPRYRGNALCFPAYVPQAIGWIMSRAGLCPVVLN